MLEFMFFLMTKVKSKPSNKFKTLDGHMNLRILVLKTDKLSTFLRPASNLLHSIIADGKSDFLKKLWLILRRGMFSGFLVKYNLPVTGIKLKKY